MLIMYPNWIMPLLKRNETWVYGKCRRLGCKATLASSVHQSMGSKLLDHMYSVHTRGRLTAMETSLSLPQVSSIKKPS
jgi:hypothetical protein